MDEQAFRSHADNALNRLHRLLSAASDDYDFEADLQNGALTIEFEQPPAKFVVSPNTPVRQIWVSAHSKSYKLDWDENQNAFVLPGGQTLRELIEEAIARQLGKEIEL